MRIVRIWLYKIIEDLKQPDCKPSDTNTVVTKDVVGRFEYYELDGENARVSSRAAADAWSFNTKETVETMRGYPTFMHDQGYRV